MSIKEQLKGLRAISKTIDSKHRQLMQLKRYYTNVKAFSYSKDKIKGGVKKDFTDTVCKIVDLENEITKDIDALCDKKNELDKFVKSILSGVEYAVIQMRYFEGLQWEEICLKINASWRKTHYIHSNALRNLENNKSVHTFAH